MIMDFIYNVYFYRNLLGIIFQIAKNTIILYSECTSLKDSSAIIGTISPSTDIAGPLLFQYSERKIHCFSMLIVIFNLNLKDTALLLRDQDDLSTSQTQSPSLCTIHITGRDCMLPWTPCSKTRLFGTDSLDGYFMLQ